MFQKGSGCCVEKREEGKLSEQVSLQEVKVIWPSGVME